MELFKINGHDYGDYIPEGGLTTGYAERSMRTIFALDGTAYKGRAAVKRTLDVSFEFMPDSVKAQLETDTSALAFDVTYHDSTGDTTKTFMSDEGLYGSAATVMDGVIYWDALSLALYER